MLARHVETLSGARECMCSFSGLVQVVVKVGMQVGSSNERSQIEAHRLQPCSRAKVQPVAL